MEKPNISEGEWVTENVTTHTGDFWKVKSDISVCNITTRNQEKARANANLIAAAPQLLNALQNAVCFIENCPYIKDDKQPKGLEKWNDIINNALGK